MEDMNMRGWGMSNHHYLLSLMMVVLLMGSLLYQDKGQGMDKDMGKDLLYNSMVKLKDKDLITITKDIYLTIKALTIKIKASMSTHLLPS